MNYERIHCTYFCSGFRTNRRTCLLTNLCSCIRAGFLISLVGSLMLISLLVPIINASCARDAVPGDFDAVGSGWNGTDQPNVLYRDDNRLMFNNEPVKLVAYNCYGMITESDFDYESFLRAISNQYGINFVRVWGNYHWTNDLLPFEGVRNDCDLQNFNQAYFDRLANFVACAGDNGIIVMYTFFDSCMLESGSLRWPNCPYNIVNNCQSYLADPVQFDDVPPDTDPPVWDQVNKPFIKRVVETIGDYGNVVYEIMNEPYDPLGNATFHYMAVDTLYGELHRERYCGSKVICVNDDDLGIGAYGKIDVVSYHVHNPDHANDYNGYPKPVIISNDGDISQSSWSMPDMGERCARIRDYCENTFNSGAILGHNHFECLDKDLYGDTWQTEDYDPRPGNLNPPILEVLDDYPLPLPVENDVPSFSDFSPEETSDPSPDCAVSVVDTIYGLDVFSAGYTFSRNGGVTWWVVDPSGSSGIDSSHAGDCPQADGWEYEDRAEGAPDGDCAHSPNVDPGEILNGRGWGFSDPPGEETITRVEVGMYERVQYDSGKYQLILQLHAGGPNFGTFSHSGFAWDIVDITSDQSDAWTWNEVNVLDLGCEHYDHPGGYRDSDAWVDAFMVRVTYEGSGSGDTLEVSDPQGYAWLEASCSGESGSTNPETITAFSVPFDQYSRKRNRIIFRVDDMSDERGISPPYTVRVIPKRNLIRYYGQGENLPRIDCPDGAFEDKVPVYNTEGTLLRAGER